MSRPRLVPTGDCCLSVVFEERIDPQVNARCVDIAAALAERALAGVRDIVPTYNAVAVHFDPTVADRHELADQLGHVAASARLSSSVEPEPIAIPVGYGGEEGPDLAEVAAFARCSQSEVVRLHSGTVYRVYMMGFLPGFAYMGSVDPRIAMPRRDVPRSRVPAGSVGIAGLQTGVYPCDSPGGWRIIGRTPATLFDPRQASPFLLKAGDRVTFVAG